MEEIEETDCSKRLLPGQVRIGDALAGALAILVEDAIQPMREREIDYEAWYRRSNGTTCGSGAA
jgi:hypothetical protein